MDSRLLSNLNAQAGGTRDPVIWAKAVCRAAAHFAAHGKTHEALTAIGVVRAQFGVNLHFDIASWLMLAEGVLHYFKAELPQAYDRVRRAYGLAIALQNNSAFPACAAWMAHLEFNDAKYLEMSKHIEEALTRATPTDNQAIARASLVLATAFHYANDFERARPWYEKARLNAASEGDDATVSATLHNMASLRAWNVRIDDSFGGETSKETQRVTLEAGSSLTYDYAIGHRGLDFLGLMLQGLIATIDRKFDAGLAKLEQIDLSNIPLRLRPLVLVDIAWCQTQLGDEPAGWQNALKTASIIDAARDNDDIAYVNSRMKQICLRNNQPEEAARYESAARQALEQHRQVQRELLATLLAIKTKPQ
jgi:hypothetical protein